MEYMWAKSFSVQLTLLTTTRLTVEIVIVNNIPDDIFPPSPPIYPLASSMTLFCHVHGSIGDVKYSWMTTAASNFTFNSESQFNRKLFLTFDDAGVYTCSASDSAGNTGQANTEIKFNGAELYVDQSANYNTRLVANNSIIVHCDSLTTNCVREVDMYCYSNTTLEETEAGGVTLPNGISYSTLLNSQYTVRKLYSAVNLVVKTRLNQGIYSFMLPDSNGNILHLSVGIYESYPGAPITNASLSSFIDLTTDKNATALAQIECYTTRSPATNVTWMRNGELLTIDGIKYDTIQIVSDRINSSYRNILLVNDVLSIVGNLTFSCIISNLNGSSSLNIPTNVTVISTALIIPKKESVYEGHTVVLQCEGSVHPVKFAAQLAFGGHISVEWFGPDGNLITGNSLIGKKKNSNIGSTRILTIEQTNVKHTGLYSCQVTLDLPNVPLSHNVSTQYHLVLLKNLTVSLPDSEVPPIIQPDDLTCTWNGGEIARMEWLFLNRNIIVPMEYTNMSWNNEKFACMQMSTEPINVTVKATFTNNVSIEPSKDRPTAGEVFRLTCTVFSDGPSVIEWVGEGIGSEGVTVYSQSVNGLNSTTVIEFQPLRTSHGGTYMCISSVSRSPSAHDSKLDYIVEVYIPGPSVTVEREPRQYDQLLSNTKLSLICIVEYALEVDTEVFVNATWTSTNNLSRQNSRITYSYERLFHSINHTLTINPLIFNDSDVYTCTANVLPSNDSTSTVYGSYSTTEELSVTVSLNVTILVDYDPLPDFTLQSPPYYQPATPVSLTCVVNDGTPPMGYRWSSTCFNCFASSGSRSNHISTNVLTTNDVGTHKCTAYDAEGRSGYATSEMNLIGTGISVQGSQYSSLTPVANNTMLRACGRCTVTITCYSNLTANISRPATIIFPNNYVYSFFNSSSVNRLVPSGVQLVITLTSSAYYTGVFTCRFTNADGNFVDASIGVKYYQRFFINDQTPAIFSSSYQDFYSSNIISPLAELRCQSQDSTPTSVIWYRNGRNVNLSNGYKQSSVVLNRRSFAYDNILRVYDIRGLLGNNTYTCSIQNVIGRDIEIIHMDNTVSKIIVSSIPFYGDNFVLKCIARHPPEGYGIHMQLEWFGPNGHIAEADITIGEQYVFNHTFQRDLIFSYPVPNLNGEYMCRLTVYFNSSMETLVEENTYHLKVMSKLNTNAQSNNTFYYIAGIFENIVCSWSGDELQKLEWFLEGVESVPIMSEVNTSSLTLSPDLSTDGLNGTTFICRATTERGDIFETNVLLHIRDVKIHISISSNNPPDFLLPSPPFYQPTSSVTFTCSISGAREPIQYTWMSTSPTSFVHLRRYATISRRNLNIEDAGLHTCSTLDGDGYILNASTTMQLIGGGLYVTYSRYISERPVANNTALVVRGCYRCTVLDIHCASNSSVGSPSIILPTSLNTGRDNYNIYVASYANYIGRIGIYTCRMTDSNGLPVDMSFGVYRYLPFLQLVGTEFQNLIESPVIPGSVLATYTCLTRSSPPTTVTWIRNGVPLTIDNIHYRTIQVVTDRLSSSYKNILLVYDITALLGNPTYNCSIRSNDQYMYGVIDEGLTVPGPTELWTSADPVYKTQFSLMCRAIIAPQYMNLLAPYIDVEWSYPESQQQNDSSVLEEMNQDNFTSSLTFLSPNSSHNGIYTCKSILRLPNRKLELTPNNSFLLSLEAITVTGNEEPFIIGVPKELRCFVKEENIKTMEWILGSDNVTLAAENNTNQLTLTVNASEETKEEWFICRALTYSGYQFEKHVLITARELRHSVAITTFSDTQTAGTTVTLTCIVISDLPSLITWSGPSGPVLTNSSDLTITQDIILDSVIEQYDPTDNVSIVAPRSSRVLKGVSNLTFHPLHASDGAVYTCNSIVNVTSVRKNASQAYSLNVQLPPPVVEVSREKEGDIQIGSTEVLRCSVAVLKVNVPTILTVMWKLYSSLLNESRIPISETTKELNHSLSLEIESYRLNDSGIYTCIALVMPSAETSATVEGGMSSSTIALNSTSALNVTIKVDYNPPPDFTLPSPPYYRPASSVTLTCIAHNAISHVHYFWKSTEDRSFAYGRNRSSIYQKILTVNDAGVHTCTATDVWGNSGAASTEISLFGIGIYVEESEYTVNSSITNNTNLYLKRGYCRQCKIISFYCYSNMTDSDVVMNYPKVLSRNRYYDYNIGAYRYREVDPWQIQYLPNNESISGLHMSVVQSSSNDIAVGTYSCDNSLFLQTQIMAFGIYRSIHDQGSISVRYNDFTDNTSTTELATVTCETRRFHPESVLWLRNGELLLTDGHNYETVQILNDRSNSFYENKLIIRDTIGLVNNPTYTCEASYGNTTVTRNTTITIGITVEVTAEISASSSTSAVYGNSYTLTCLTNTVESNPTLTNPLLRHFLTIDWFDRDNNSITAKDSLTVGNISNEFSRTLHFHPLRKGHDRLYVCVATLNIPGAISVSTSQYRLILDTAYFQLKFNPISCTFLSENQMFAADLENSIKQTLIDVINKECDCNFEKKLIFEGEFNCIKSTSITYRAGIVGGRDIQSTVKLLGILKRWKRSYGTVLFSSSFSLRLWVDPFCPLEIHSFRDPLC